MDATIVVNRLGTVEEVDEGACTLLGYSKGELVGLHGSELIPTEAQPATAASIDRVLHSADAEAQARFVVERLARLAACAALNAGGAGRVAALFAGTRLAARRGATYGTAELDSGEIGLPLSRALPEL